MSPCSHPASPFVTRTVLLCVGALGTAVSAFGQAPPTAFWDLSLRAQGAWYSNPDFTQTVPAVLSSRAGVGLGYTRSSTAGDFAFFVDAAAAFDNQPAGNNLNYSGQLGWRRQLGPHTSLQVRDSLTQSYSQSTPLLIESGLIYPYALIRTNDASVSLSHQLTTRTSFSVSGRHRWAEFPGSQLPSGQRASVSAGVGRTVSDVDQVGLSYSYGWDDTQGATYGNQTMSTSWTRRLGVSTSGTVSIGGSYWKVLPEGSSQWILSASASLNGRRGRTSYGLTYSRSPELVYGTTRERIANVMSGTLGRQLTRILSGSVRGVWSRGRDVLDSSYTYDTQGLFVGLTIQPRPTFNIGGGYSWTHLALNGVIQNSHSFDLAVSYGWRWR